MVDEPIEIKIDNKEVNRKLLDLVMRGENLRPLMKNIAGIFAYSTVENFKEESVSDISFWYTIEIISSLKDVEVELYTNEENIPIIDFKTNPIFISNCKKVKQDYKLKITYKGDNTSEISEKIKIKIEAEQEKTYV